MGLGHRGHAWEEIRLEVGRKHPRRPKAKEQDSLRNIQGGMQRIGQDSGHQGRRSPDADNRASVRGLVDSVGQSQVEQPRQRHASPLRARMEELLQRQMVPRALDQVRPLDVQEWLLDIPKSTAKIALGVPRRTVDLAVSYEVVSENKFRRQYELGEHIPFSSLRNSWRTFAQFEWRISSETLEVLMGHKLPGTSGRHYIRPSLELLAESFARDYVKNTRS